MGSTLGTKEAHSAPRSRGWVVLALLLAMTWFWSTRPSASESTEIPYTTAFAWVRDGKVSEVTIEGDSVTGKLRAPETHEERSVSAFQTCKPDDDAFVPLLRDKGVTRGELLARLCVLLGGTAAERIALGDSSTGAEHDLREATRIASRMVAHYGMSDEIGPVYLEHREEHAFLGQRIASDGGTSDASVYRIENEVRQLLREALATSSATIERHRDMFDRLVAALLGRETLERDELRALLGEPAVADASIPVVGDPLDPRTFA